MKCRKNTALLRIALSTATLALLGQAAGAAPAAVPPPFTATYEVTFRGLRGGTLNMQLKRGEQPGRYIFETHANPTTLARLFISSDAMERSVLETTDTGTRPLSWVADDGKSSKKGDGKLQFDWPAQRVTGEIEGKPVSLPTEAGLQDRMSIQVGVISQLLQGKEPGTIAMIDDERIKHYTYTRSGTTQLDTELGSYDAVIYESTRPGSSRVSRVWHAPSLDYVPVRMEQVRKGKVETVMTLIELKRGEETGSDGVMK